MHYKITMQEQNDSWVYVITFGKNTPTAIEQAAEFSDNSVRSQDLLGIRHYVYFKHGKIVQIQLHDALRILPHLNPERPETICMPEMLATRTGEPPVPTLLMKFKQEALENRVAYALSPNVFLLFHGNELAQLHVTNVRASI